MLEDGFPEMTTEEEWTAGKMLGAHSQLLGRKDKVFTFGCSLLHPAAGEQAEGHPACPRQSQNHWAPIEHSNSLCQEGAARLWTS